MLDFLNILLLGVILGAGGILLLAKNEQQGWELQFVPYFFAAITLLAAIQIARWVLKKRLPNQRLQLTDDARD